MSSNPTNIVLNYSLPFSPEPLQVTFGVLDDQARIMMNYVALHAAAIAISGSFILLLTLFVKKKLTPIFILNQSILVLLIIRSALFMAFQLGPMGSITTAFTGIIILENQDKYKISVAANGVYIILVTLIEVSFTYQIFIIFKSPEVRKLRFILTTFSSMIGMAVFGLYVNSAIHQTKYYESLYNNTEPLVVNSWVYGCPYWVFSASIYFMCIVLVMKLYFAIKTRRYLGLKQFLSYHILLIMFSQALLIPSILVILNYCLAKRLNNTDVFLQLSVIFTAISLPFTSFWSSVANNSRSLLNSPSFYLNLSSDSEDEASTLKDDYSLFPKQLSKLSSPVSNYEAPSPTTLNQFNLDNNRIPEDIIEILKEEADIMDRTLINKHLSTISNETSDDVNFVTNSTVHKKFK